MKAKIFIKILLLIVFFSNIQLSFSQSSTDLMKYWYYRNRLKYFVIPGNKLGESQIMSTRNRIDNENGRIEGIDYGQAGEHDGFYIGVLATEYYLLNKNGQTTDAINTLNELYYALHTVNIYWDSLAEPYWNKSGSANGFFIRGNAPCDFLDTTNIYGNGFAANGKTNLSLLNKGLKTSDYYDSQQPFSFGSFPQGHPGYVNYIPSNTCTPLPPASPQAMSQDEAIGILMGCALAAKLGTGAAQTLAKNMVANIVSYVINEYQMYGSNYFRMYNPDGSMLLQVDVLKLLVLVFNNQAHKLPEICF